MAQRRMFSQRIVDSARFLKMSPSAQNLYFHFGMRADDDGVVEAFPVMQMLGAAEDDFRILVTKGFIKPLNEDLVSFILDWNEHNLIRADRKIDSIYKDLLLSIVPEADLIEARPRADTGKVTGRPMDDHGTSNGPHRLGKDRIGNIPEFLGKNSAPSFLKEKPQKVRAYNESNPADDLPSVDSDGGDPEPEAAGVKPNLLRTYRSMLKWSEERRGFGFPVHTKQFKAFKTAVAANISPTRLKQRWEELEQDDFYSTKGFDWTDVVSSFSKRA